MDLLCDFLSDLAWLARLCVCGPLALISLALLVSFGALFRAVRLRRWAASVDATADIVADWFERFIQWA